MLRLLRLTTISKYMHVPLDLRVPNLQIYIIYNLCIAWHEHLTKVYGEQEFIE